MDILKPKSYTSYEYQIRQHIKPALGHLPLKQVQAQDVREFIRKKLADGLSPSTVRQLRTTLRVALNVAVADGRVERNAAALAKPPKLEKRPANIFTPEQARLFLKLVEDHRLEALFVALIALGLRVGEGLGLKWSDVDLAARKITVNRSLQRAKMPGEKKTALLLVSPKSNTSQRTLGLPDIAVRALAKHKLRQDAERAEAAEKWTELEFVFTTPIGTPIDPRNVTREADAIMTDEKITLPRLRLHDLRHSAASLLIAQGRHPREIMETLGHSQISLTMDLYGHIFDSVKRDVADAMDTALTGEPEATDDKRSNQVATKVATVAPPLRVQ